MKKTLFSALLFLIVGSLFAQGSIEGIWFNTSKSAKIEIYKKGEFYHGKIVWLDEPIDEKTNKPKVDENNPEASLQKAPILGLSVLKNFTADGSSEYSGGTIYDPENGKTYKCKMTLQDKEHLDVRGYVGISVFGRTENWTRAAK